MQEPTVSSTPQPTTFPGFEYCQNLPDGEIILEGDWVTHPKHQPNLVPAAGLVGWKLNDRFGGWEAYRQTHTGLPPGAPVMEGDELYYDSWKMWAKSVNWRSTKVQSSGYRYRRPLPPTPTPTPAPSEGAEYAPTKIAKLEEELSAERTRAAGQEKQCSFFRAELEVTKKTLADTNSKFPRLNKENLELQGELAYAYDSLSIERQESNKLRASLAETQKVRDERCEELTLVRDRLRALENEFSSELGFAVREADKLRAEITVLRIEAQVAAKRIENQKETIRDYQIDKDATGRICNQADTSAQGQAVCFNLNGEKNGYIFQFGDSSVTATDGALDPEVRVVPSVTSTDVD